MTTIHIDKSVDRRGQDVSVLMESMEENHVEESSNHTKQVHCMPHLVSAEIVLVGREVKIL